MVAVTLSCVFSERMDRNRGAKDIAINPSAELIPCILEAKVSISFILFTLKIPAKTPAPIANKLINTTKAMVSSCEAEPYNSIMFFVDINNRMPNETSQKLYRILTGLSGLPNTLITCF